MSKTLKVLKVQGEERETEQARGWGESGTGPRP